MLNRTTLISIAASIKRTLQESLQSFLESKLPTYGIIAFFIASRLVDVTLLEFDVNIYIELEDIFAIDLFVLCSDLEEHRLHIFFLSPLKH